MNGAQKISFMQANSIDNRTFQLTIDENLLGELIYENIFLMKAHIVLPDLIEYQIKQVGFFGTSISITRDDAEIANLKMNWRGHVVIDFPDEQVFILKSQGLFNNKFVLENTEEEKLIVFDPKFDWKKFKYNYDIDYNETPADILLILLGVYASNYYMAMMAGAM